MTYLIYIIIGYLIGSIPFGYIITKFFAKENLHNIGSGSTGATNVTRILGLKIGILVFLLDFFKAFSLIIYLKLSNNILYLNNESIPMVISFTAIAIILGHCWPIFIKFKGGKGVAPAVGSFTAIAYEISLLTLIISLFLIKKTKTASIGSLSGVLISFVPFISLIIIGIYQWEYLIFYLGGLTIIIIRHKENIKRLIHNNERKF
ncbi:MAG: acyl-phosphate glycerol 3-phosphate acyltransferase [Chloroflexi bacterium]|nr:acyl-phosphate glycerol 3-phosphate acyltransferase [Chloroflexota bacterium]